MMGNQPVDNNTYNLIAALAKNLEACEVYEKYARDGNRQLWEQLLQTAQRNAQLLQQELVRTIGISSMSDQLPDSSSYSQGDARAWNAQDSQDMRGQQVSQGNIQNDYISHNKTGQDASSYISHDKGEQSDSQNYNQSGSNQDNSQYQSGYVDRDTTRQSKLD
jgi:hypothetical protein